MSFTDDQDPEHDDVIHDHCGIAGIYDPTGTLNVPQYLVIAMSALQHRGQESAGIAILKDDGEIYAKTEMGRVREVFKGGTDGIPNGKNGIGHVRYSTTGSSCVENAAPFVLKGHTRLFFDSIAVAHNGNVLNAAELLPLVKGIALNSDTDSEVIAGLLLTTPGATFAARLRQVAAQLKGAYSLVLLSEGKLFGLRDPFGMRPLSIGKLGEGYILASETCALDRVGATFMRELEPGEFVMIDEQGLHFEHYARRNRRALCVFEFVYFSEATSTLDDRSVYEVREEIGRQLARQHPVDADLVVPVPLTSIPMALGYAEASGLPYAEPIIPNRYADRSFIKPDQRLRQMEIDLKFNIVESKVRGKRLVVVDDSIVRGNTLPILIKALRRKGAKEVHFRIGSPPIKHPCYFGVDIPDEQDLPASSLTVEQIRQRMSADSLGYLSLAALGRATTGMLDEPPSTALAQLHHRFCFGCMDQRGYPIAIKSRVEEPTAIA